MIQVNTTLTKSMVNPEFDIRGEKGIIVHKLPDGYSLVSFKQFLVKKKYTYNGKTRHKFVPLEWYVNEADYVSYTTKQPKFE